MTDSTRSRPVAHQPRRRRRVLAWVLGLLFALTFVMGPGPGSWLVNPNPLDPDAVTAIGTIPILYLWALLWYGVQVAVLLTAYFLLWGDSHDAA